MVQSDVVQLDLVGRHAEAGGKPTLEPDRNVAQAQRAVALVEERPGDDAHRVGEIDDPGVALRAFRNDFGDIQHDRHGPQRLGKATRAGRLLAEQAEPARQRLVDQPGLLTLDPQLYEHSGGGVDGLVQ
jgi:hypothetical protein